MGGSWRWRKEPTRYQEIDGFDCPRDSAAALEIEKSFGDADCVIIALSFQSKQQSGLFSRIQRGERIREQGVHVLEAAKPRQSSMDEPLFDFLRALIDGPFGGVELQN